MEFDGRLIDSLPAHASVVALLEQIAVELRRTGGDAEAVEQCALQLRRRLRKEEPQLIGRRQDRRRRRRLPRMTHQLHFKDDGPSF